MHWLNFRSTTIILQIDMTILITGATGFIGRALTAHLARNHFGPLRLASRKPFDSDAPATTTFHTGDIDSNTDWSNIIRGVTTVIHCAGIAHKRHVSGTEYFKTHVAATRQLAAQCISEGVDQFIYISSIGVHGRTSESHPFSESSPCNPGNTYTSSKKATEDMLIELCRHNAMALTILRPPLVYAAHAPGNFKRLMDAVFNGVPLPFGSIKNQRSMMALDNLVSVISHCIGHPAARGEVFVVADTSPPLTTANIVRQLAIGMSKPARLLCIPDWILRGGATCLGQREKYLQLCGNLAIDTGKLEKKLAWRAPLESEKAFTLAGMQYAAMQSQSGSSVKHQKDCPKTQ